MKSVYVMKITTLGRRPTPQTPLEPMLVQLGDGEVLALFPYPDSTVVIPTATAAAPVGGSAAAKPLPEVDLDQKCKVKLEVKAPDLTKKEQECVFTIKLTLD